MSWRREKRRPSLPNPEIQAGGVKPVCFWTRTYGSERWSSFSLKRKCRRQFRVRASIRPIHRKQHSHLVTYQLLRSDGQVITTEKFFHLILFKILKLCGVVFHAYITLVHNLEVFPSDSAAIIGTLTFQKLDLAQGLFTFSLSHLSKSPSGSCSYTCKLYTVSE